MKNAAREILNTLAGWDAPAAEAVIYPGGDRGMVRSGAGRCASVALLGTNS